MTKFVTVEVTQDDIDKGERFHPARCPIARALARTVNDPDVRVGPFYAHFGSTVERYRGALPASAYGLRIAFDQGKVVEPITFELECLNLEDWA